MLLNAKFIHLIPIPTRDASSTKMCSAYEARPKQIHSLYLHILASVGGTGEGGAYSTHPTLSSLSAANLVLLLVSLLLAARLRRGNPLSSNKDSPHALIRSGARPIALCVCVRVLIFAHDTYTGSEYGLSWNLLCERRTTKRQRQTMRQCLGTSLHCKIIKISLFVRQRGTVFFSFFFCISSDRYDD